MKLICPQEMTEAQAQKLCVVLASADAACPREEIASALWRQMAAIEAGIAVVDRAFPIPRSRAIDFLGVDARDRPVLVFVDDAVDAAALGSGCRAADWVEENIEAVAHLLARGHLRREARVWHVAARIDPDASALLQRMDGEGHEFFLAQKLLLGGEAWLVVTPDHPSRSKSSPGAEPSDDLLRDDRGSTLSTKSLLTDEEIDEFFEAPHPEGEEVTGSATFRHGANRSGISS